MTEIILGPPGTGKTTTLIGLVEEELERDTPPDRIGYFSFTTRAAKEARDRACSRFQLDPNQLPYFSTLHAMCYRQLGIQRSEVLTGSRLFAFADYARINLSGKTTEDGETNELDLGDRAMFMENLARVRDIPLRQQFEQNDDDLPWNFVQKLAQRLRVYKMAHGLFDYTDMLVEFLRSGVAPRLEVLIIDEGQDLTRLQWRIVEKLAPQCRRVAVAGDDDQAIYTWSGADVQYLIDMPGDVRVLGQSWRVPPAVQEVATKLTKHMGRRREKEWRARKGVEGVVNNVTSLEQATMTEEQRPGNTLPIMILARNTYILKTQVEPLLREKGVVFERNGFPSISAGLMTAIREWEKLRRGEPISGASMRTVLEWMSVHVGFTRGNKTLPGVEDEELVTMRGLRDSGKLLREDVWFEALDKVPPEDRQYIRAALRHGEKLNKRPRVMVSTIHGVKGGEADHVILMREMARRTYREMIQAPSDEARVWYVAVTRAREKLTIVGAENEQRSCPWL